MEQGKKPIKKGELMATFIKTSTKLTNGENTNKNGKGTQKGKGGRLAF